MSGFRCICCDGRKAHNWFLDCRDYYQHLPLRVSYYRCEKCGLIQQSPIPPDTSHLYHKYQVHAPRGPFVERIRRSIMKPAHFNENECARHGMLIDFGCGDGAYLRWIEHAPIKRVGFEPGVEHARQLQKSLAIPVFSDVEQLQAQYANAADVVTMHMVLEHVTDLSGTMQIASHLLKPGGVCYITAPNIRSWEARLFGRRWHGLDPPRHISFPDPPIMQRLSQQSGFTIIRHSHIRYPTGIAGSLCTLLVGRWASLPFNLLMPFAIVISHLFPGGFESYWLRKR